MPVHATRIAPGPRGLPLLGSLPEMRRKGLIQLLVDTWQEYGDVVRIPMGPLVQHLIVRPEHIRYVLVANRDNYWKGQGLQKLKLALGNGLFTNEGDHWRRQRQMLSSPFTPQAIPRFLQAMKAATSDLLARWEDQAGEHEPLEMNTQMMHLAMSVISRAMFGVDIDRDALAAGNAFTYVLEFMSERSVSLIDIPLFVPTRANRLYRQSMATLEGYLGGVIRERRRHLGDRDDLLAMLLAARDPETGEPMSDQQLFDEVVTLFFAGHETTAQALTWSWYLLAQHPDAEAQLHEEVDRVLDGRAVTGDDVPRLEYTRMVVEEAMRLYPPVWVFVRDAYADDVIGGYHIPAGSMIVLSQYITHRHPDFWEDPDRFDPERFRPGTAKDRPRYAYFPFGGGPRICLGMHFALLEAVVAVAMIAQRYHLRLVPGQRIEPKMVGTLRPGAPVMMTLEPRRGG
jgi:cytochrome P450